MNKEKTHSSLLQAELIGHKVPEILKTSKSKLGSRNVFEHAIYIDCGKEGLIKIIKDKEFVSPRSIVIRGMGNISFKSLDIENGTELALHNDNITAKENEFTLHLANASTWYPPELPDEKELLSIEEINLNLRILNDLIYTSPSREGLVPLLENVEKFGPLEVFVKDQEPSMSEKARPYIDALMWGIMSGDIEAVKRGAEPILGLGPGLTPSCDDFLAGLMLSINTAGVSLFRDEPNTVQFFSAISKEISTLAEGKTTIYSLSFLSEAALGEGPKTALDLIYAIITKSPERVAEISKKLIGVGATSGADISIGIYFGIRFLSSRIELRDLNEFE
jgi:hypothetical protein